ncbi:MAG TPA: hypothetical protein VLM43_03785 [Desulfobacterales bacterium]|nr:hypothetical protein [Desulfobacterales bacterium]
MGKKKKKNKSLVTYPEYVMISVLSDLKLPRRSFNGIIKEIFNFCGRPGVNWPDWCFMPVEIWLNYLRDAIEDVGPEFSLSELLGLKNTNEEYLRIEVAHYLAAFAAWNYTKGIYRFEEDLLKAITAGAFPKTLPVNVFLRLPEWCVYIDLSHVNKDLAGFFVFIDDIEDFEHPVLSLVFAPKQNHWPSRYEITLEQTSIDKQILDSGNVPKYRERLSSSIGAELTEEQTVAYLKQDYETLLKVVLYLCIDQPDIKLKKYPETSPSRPSITTKNGEPEYFVTAKPRIWQVGKTQSDSMRAARKAANRKSGYKVKPHWRSAHYHGVWRGTGEDRYFHLNWWPPTPIGTKS